MSNGEVCCILGVCCPPGSFEQAEALAHEIQKRHPNMDIEKARGKAGRVLEKHDYFRDILEIVDTDEAAKA